MRDNPPRGRFGTPYTEAESIRVQEARIQDHVDFLNDPERIIPFPIRRTLKPDSDGNGGGGAA